MMSEASNQDSVKTFYVRAPDADINSPATPDKSPPTHITQVSFVPSVRSRFLSTSASPLDADTKLTGKGNADSHDPFIRSPSSGPAFCRYLSSMSDNGNHTEEISFIPGINRQYTSGSAPTSSFDVNRGGETDDVNLSGARHGEPDSSSGVYSGSRSSSSIPSTSSLLHLCRYRSTTSDNGSYLQEVLMYRHPADRTSRELYATNDDSAIQYSISSKNVDHPSSYTSELMFRTLASAAGGDHTTSDTCTKYDRSPNAEEIRGTIETLTQLVDTANPDSILRPTSVDSQSVVTCADRREYIIRQRVGLSVHLRLLEQTDSIDSVSLLETACGEVDRRVADLEHRANDHIIRSTADDVLTPVRLNSPDDRVNDGSRTSAGENHFEINAGLSIHPAMSPLPQYQHPAPGPLHDDLESISLESAIEAHRTAGGYEGPDTDVSKTVSSSRAADIDEQSVNQLYERYASDLSAEVIRRSFAILAQLQTIATSSTSGPDTRTDTRTVPLDRQLTVRPVGRGQHVVTDSGLLEGVGENTGSGQCRYVRDNRKDVGSDEILEDIFTLTSGLTALTSSEHVATEKVEAKMHAGASFMSHGWFDDVIEDVEPADDLSDNSLWSRASVIIQSEVGESALENIKVRQDRSFRNANLAKTSKIDGPALLAKAPNVPLNHAGVKLTESDVSSVAGVGFAVIGDAERLPPNKFFVPGRVFPVRIKHSSFPVAPAIGARANYKTFSIKFGDHDEDSPFDLLLCTGQHGPYYNVTTMDQFYAALRAGTPEIKNYLLSNPVCLESVLDGIRLDPSSYCDQRYYSHCVYEFKGTDGVRRMARFRVTPGDQRTKQTGRLTPEQEHIVWSYLSGEDLEPMSTRPESYLRDEFVQRLTSGCGSAQYTLQIQLRDDDDDLDTASVASSTFRRQLSLSLSTSGVATGAPRYFFNPSRGWWDVPWINVARITIGQPLPVSSTSFDIGRLPSGTLQLMDPFDADDFCSSPALESYLARMANQSSTSAGAAVDGDSTPEVGPVASLVLTDYLIHIATGDCTNAGTPNNIAISIVGTSGRTPYMKLNRQLKTDLERGVSKTFVVWERPVGQLQYVQVYNDGAANQQQQQQQQQQQVGMWFLAYAIISTPYNGRCYTLPCYRWIANRQMVTLRDGAAKTKNRELDPFSSMMRDVETSDRRQHLQWRDQSFDPLRMYGYVAAVGDINLLPSDWLTDATKNAEKTWSEFKPGKSLLEAFIQLFATRKGSITVEFEKSLADKIQQKYQNSKQLVHVIRHWRDDEEFARQLFNGTHPSLIVRVKHRLPPEFADLKDELLRADLLPDRSLQDELNDGNLYMISYSQLNDFAQLCHLDPSIGTNPKKSKPSPVRYISAPSVLFYLKRNEDSSKVSMIPIAIRLNPPSTPAVNGTSNGQRGVQRSGATAGAVPPTHALSPLLTRLDARVSPDGTEYTDWMVGKMWLKMADVHYRLLGALMGSRLLVETVSLAVYRSLPSVHPVHKLLVPHITDIVGLNTVYRRYVLEIPPPDVAVERSSLTSKIVDGGFLASVLALGDRPSRGLCARFITELLKATTIESLNIRKNYERLGLLNVNLPAGYWYRDDTMPLWDAIWNFVNEILSIYYSDAADVAADVELLQLLKELREQSVSEQTYPEKFETLLELTEFVTVIIFTCTVQQTALRRSAVDVYAYCPNAPPCMMTAPPSERSQRGHTEQQMRDMLPTPDLADQFIDVVKELAGDDKPPRFTLGCYSDRLFTEEAPLVVIDRFRSRLRQISDDMNNRNKALACPYEYLLPENIYQSFCG